jgi:hypothetical protein
MKGGAGGGGFAEWKWAGWLRWWLHKVSSTWRVSRFEGILASCSLYFSYRNKSNIQ